MQQILSCTCKFQINCLIRFLLKKPTTTLGLIRINHGPAEFFLLIINWIVCQGISQLDSNINLWMTGDSVIPSLCSIKTYCIHFFGQKNVSQGEVTVNDAMRVKIQDSLDNLSHNVTSYWKKKNGNPQLNIIISCRLFPSCC